MPRFFPVFFSQILLFLVCSSWLCCVTGITPSPSPPPPAACTIKTLPESNVKMLNALFTSTRGGEWTVNTGWGEGDPCQAKWHGLTCICPGGQATVLMEVSLIDNKLAGTLPEGFFTTGAFTSLQKLDLSMNIISGALPTMSNADLPELHFLYLQQAAGTTVSLVGDISNIFAVSSLRQMDLRNNAQLTGTLPETIGSLVPSLEVIDMAGCGVKGALPESFWDISGLTNVDLSGLGLSGTIGAGVKDMAGMRILLAPDNVLSGVIPPFHESAFSIPPCIIMLNNNNFASFPPQFMNAGVKELSLSNNTLSGTFPAGISGASAITHLYLDNNHLSGSIPPSVCTLRDLVEFQVAFNYLTSLPDCFGKDMPSLQYLEIFNNVLTGTIPMDSLCNLVALRQLQVQNNVYLEGQLKPCVSNWEHLEVLIVDRTMLSGTIPDEVFGMKNLTTLIISQSKFEGTIPDLFGATPKLQAIVIQSSHVGNIVLDPAINGTIPQSIFSLTKLQSLTLQFNKLSGTIPDRFNNAPYLAQIALNNNAFTGTIPATLLTFLASRQPSDMNMTRSVYINNNYLTGTIPNDFMQSQGTSEIVINYNPFSGYIPLDYNGTYSWLNGSGTVFQRDRHITFFAGMRLLPPLPLFVQYMSGVGFGFYPSGVLARSGRDNNLISRDDPSQVIDIEVAYLCDAPDFWGDGGHGIFIKIEPSSSSSSSSIDTDPPATDTYHNVLHPVPQNASFPQSYANLSFSLPLSVLSVLPNGPILFSIWFKGNTMANESDVSGHVDRVQKLSNMNVAGIIYEATPPIYEISPRSGRKWGCASIAVSGANFTDVGDANLLCRYTARGGTVFFSGGSYVNDSSVTCFIPNNDTLAHPLGSVVVAVSLDQGENWSIQDSHEEDLTYTFEDDCELSPQIPSLKDDCLCGMCECSSAGVCGLNVTKHEMMCTCDEGFTEADCSECTALRWGVDCKECPTCNAPYGRCKESKLGDGSCVCDMWYAGKNCGWYYFYWVVAGVPACVGSLVLFIAYKKLRTWYRRSEERKSLLGVQSAG